MAANNSHVLLTREDCHTSDRACPCGPQFLDSEGREISPAEEDPVVVVHREAA